MLLVALLAMGGVAALRWAWGLPRRSPVANAGGWTLLLAALIAGAQAGGAWGMAIASLWAMGAATLALAIAALRSPRKMARAPKRGVGALPAPGEPLGFGRRLATFALTVPLSLLASIALAIGLRVLALAAGWSEADGNALALFMVPIAWALLATLLLFQSRRGAQLATLAIAALPGALALA